MKNSLFAIVLLFVTSFAFAGEINLTDGNLLYSDSLGVTFDTGNQTPVLFDASVPADLKSGSQLKSGVQLSAAMVCGIYALRAHCLGIHAQHITAPETGATRRKSNSQPSPWPAWPCTTRLPERL